MYGKASAVLETLLTTAGDSPLVVGCCAGARALVGDGEGYQHLYKRLTESATGYRPPIVVAWIQLMLGEPERCLDWLEKAVEERDPLIVEFQPKPFYDGLRHHARFQALLSAMRLID
jgi:hypothetical protein